jgi:hypothetical protein
MQGLKPSILMGNLKQSLPHDVRPGNDLFLAMFLIRLTPPCEKWLVPGTTRRSWRWLKEPCRAVFQIAAVVPYTATAT